MSECTSIYLRNKEVESQRYRECPGHGDKEGKKKVVSYNSTKANIKYCFQCLII